MPAPHGSMLKIVEFFKVPQSPPRWFWEVIVLPFLIARLVWELVGFFAAGNFLSNPSYAIYFKRGYFLTRFFPLDIFTRWDSHWYFSILKFGYQAPVDLNTTYSNLAFFPLYPYLARSIGCLGLQLPDAFYFLVGFILSNLFFLSPLPFPSRLLTPQL